MRIVHVDDVPTDRIEARFKSLLLGAISTIILTLAGSALPVAFVVGVWRTGVPTFLLVLLAIGFGLLTLLLLWATYGAVRSLVAWFNPSSWLMTVTADGVYLNARSYRNAHFDAVWPTVVFIDFDEIASAGQLRECVRLRERRGTTHQYRWYLELILRHQDTDLLKELMAKERAFKPRKGGRWQHWPVLVPRAGEVRVDWRGKRMLRALEWHVPIVERRAVDLSKAMGDTAGADDLIIALVERGETIEAVKVARKAYQMSLVQAKRFVDDLTSGSDGCERL